MSAPSRSRTDGALAAARSFARPVGWRGRRPDAAGLEGCLLFERTERATGFDGTELAYGVFGNTGPWVVLVPGFGCPDNFWKYLLRPLSRRFRVIVYDTRGVGMSGYPRRPGYRAHNLKTADFSIENHAKDVVAIMDAAGADRAALIGHSMGGQIALETYRAAPDRLSALVMLTAPFASPTRTLYGRDLAFLDPIVLMKMADAMRAHSARDVLPLVDVPTLIVAGELDPFTPPALAHTMHDEIRDSELVMLEGASHGAVIEKPDDVIYAVTSFLERRVGRSASSPRRTRAALG